MIDLHSTPLPSRRQGRWNRILIAIFGILIAYCVACYVLVLASIPVYYQRVVSGGGTDGDHERRNDDQ